MKKLFVAIIAVTLALLIAWNWRQEKPQVVFNALGTNRISHEVGKNSMTPHSEQVQGPEMVSRPGDEKVQVSDSHDEIPALLASPKTPDYPKLVGAALSSTPVQKPPVQVRHSTPDVFPSLSSSSVSATPGLPSASTMVWEVDEALPLPVVLAQSDSELAGPLLNANESIIQEFEKGIGSSSSANSDVEVTTEIWLQAKSKADARYKALYGDAAYNQRAMQAMQSNLVK